MQRIQKFKLPIATIETTDLFVTSQEFLRNGKFNGKDIAVYQKDPQVIRNYGEYFNGIPKDKCFVSFDEQGNVTFLGNTRFASKDCFYLTDFDKVVDGVPYCDQKVVTDPDLQSKIHVTQRTELIKKLRKNPIENHQVTLTNNGQIKIAYNTTSPKGYKIELVENYEAKQVAEGFYELNSSTQVKNKETKKMELGKQYGYKYFGNLLYEENLIKQDNYAIWAEQKNGNIVFIGKFLDGMKHGYGVSFPKGVKITEDIKLFSNSNKQIYGRWYANRFEEQLDSEWQDLIKKVEAESNQSSIAFDDLVKFLEAKNYSIFGNYELGWPAALTFETPDIKMIGWLRDWVYSWFVTQETNESEKRYVARE